MKCAIYCRVSSEMQAEDEIQFLDRFKSAKHFAKFKGWDVVHVYKR